MMRALVTGAGGFCGSHLVSFLRESGVVVHTAGTREIPNNNHHVVKDVTDIAALARVLTIADPDAVFHLAGVAGGADPALFYRVNTEYSVALLSAIDLAGFQDRPVLLAGTAAEYGVVPPEQLPVTEDYCAKPQRHYGISKLAQTFEALAWSKSGGCAVVARPSNIIGPGMRETLVVGSFARQIADILKGRRPAFIDTGNLNSTRDFIDVMDVARILWRLAQKPAAHGEIVNVCSGKAVPISELLASMIRLSGASIEIRLDPSRIKSIDVAAHYGSTKKLEHLLGGTLELTSLDDSLQRILEHALRASGE